MSTATDETCFHCGEPIPPGKPIYAQLKQQRAAMCCEGCRAVAELIAGVGLDDYYRYRSEPALKPETTTSDEWHPYADTELAQQFVHSEYDGQQSVVLILQGVRCAACGWLIDRMLRRVPGVTAASVNAATARVRVVWRPAECDLATVLRTVAQLGYRPQPLNAESVHQHTQDERQSALKRLGVAGLGMMQVMMYVLPLYTSGETGMDASTISYFRVIGLLLTTPVMFYAGWPFLAGAARALRYRSINMDVPVALALSLAYIASVYNTLVQQGEVYFDSVTMFIFFLTLGRFIEMAVRHRTGGITDALARLQPRVAHRLVKDGSGHERQEDIPLTKLCAGDDVLVRVGEAVPADGRISDGCSTLDEALLTGESMPVRRQPGEAVLAGAINIDAPLQIRVTAAGNATVLAGVIALLQRAQTDKPRMALLADRIARRFLNYLLVFTVLVGVLWYWFDPGRAFDAVLAVLVVTCPCALSLATPAVIAATTTALARRGLLITRADAIEGLAQITHVVFDKTGTLTTGRIAIAQVHCSSRHGADQCCALAAVLEQSAEHPIARAFRDSVASVPLVATELRVIPGAGVSGVIDGEQYRLGTPTFVAELRGSRAATADDAAVVVLGDATGELARFELCDPVRADARISIRRLSALGLSSSVLSGDAASAVQRVAGDCGITQYRSRQTPADKLVALQAMKRDGVAIAMVGDGINDAPVLGAAAVSVAMGGGAALAQASADMVLMNNSLQTLPHAVEQARYAQHIMRQNLVWAGVYNLAAIPLAALGMIPPWLAAVGMSASSVLVVLNATRVLRQPGEHLNSSPMNAITTERLKHA